MCCRFVMDEWKGRSLDANMGKDGLYCIPVQAEGHPFSITREGQDMVFKDKSLSCGITRKHWCLEKINQGRSYGLYGAGHWKPVKNLGQQLGP